MRFATLIASLLISSLALAHTPVCRCELTGNNITCTGQFHDGSKANGVAMTVFNYHNNTLVSGELNRQSRFQFTQPQQPFYLIMDAGPGEMFEVDWKDVKGIDPASYP